MPLLQPGADPVPAFLLARRWLVEAQLRTAMGQPALALLRQALATLAQADRVDVRLSIQMETSLHLPPDEALALCRAIIDEARAHELLGHESGARARLVQAILRGGRVDEAAAIAAPLVDEIALLAPTGFYRPEAWWIAHQALSGAGQPAAARRAANLAAVWIDEARRQLPAPFQDSFMRRNPVNQALARLSG